MVRKEWQPLCEVLAHERYSALKHMVSNAVNEAFSENYKNFRQAMTERVDNVLGELEKSSLGIVKDVLERETSPFTLNHYLFDNIAKLRNERLQQRLLQMLDGKTQGIESIVRAAFSSMEKMSLEDNIAYEMQIVLGAYGKVAAKRVIDAIPMIFRDQCRQLMSKLESALLFTDTELLSLMHVDDIHVQKVKRARLTKEKLDIAYDALQQLQKGVFI